MIKANELRIGILVYAGTDENDQPQAGKVLQIFEDVIHWTFDLKQCSIAEGYNSTDVRYVDPIPLTPEWLERCGLENLGDGRWSGSQIKYEDSIDWFSVQQDKYGYRFFGSEWVHGKPFHYVHQLQNIYFAMTGEELAINS